MATTRDIPAVVNGYGVFTSLVGGGVDCISVDDGDTSYLQQHVTLASGVTSGYNDTVTFPATNIPGTVLTTSLVTVSKGNDPRSYGHPGGGVAFFLNPPSVGVTFWQTVFADGATDWTELVTPLTVAGAEVVTQAMIESGTVQYNPGSALLNCVVSGPIDFTTKWTYIALRVTYQPQSGPPVRQFPGGMRAGATRRYPRNQNQRTARRVGGTY